jgi:biopolymer transport protein ExbD
MPAAANSSSLRLAIKDGTVYLGSELVPSDLIAEEVKDSVAINPTTTAYVWADGGTSYEHLALVLNELRSVLIGRVGLITEQQGQHDSQETTRNSVPLGEQVLLIFPVIRKEDKKFYDDRGLLGIPVPSPILQIPPPSPFPSPSKEAFPIVFFIQKEHAEIRLHLGDKVRKEDVAWERLPARLREVLQDRSQGTQATRVIIIEGDKDVDVSYVAKAIDIGHSAGAEKVGLVTAFLEADGR